MSDTVSARVQSIEDQLAAMDSEKRDAITGIVHRMIEGRNIKEDEQLYDALEKLIPLNEQEINSVIEALNFETRLVLSRMLFDVSKKPAKPVDWKDAVKYRPTLEVK